MNSEKMANQKYNKKEDEWNPYSKRNLAKRGLVPGWLYWIGFGLGFMWGWIFRWLLGDPVLQFNNGSIHDAVQLSNEVHAPIIRKGSQPEIIPIVLEGPVMFRIISKQRGYPADPVDAMLLTLENRAAAEVKPVGLQNCKPASVIHFLHNDAAQPPR